MFDNVRRVSRQLAAYGTADVAVLAVNFLLLPVYTRVLSTTEYGAFALLLVVEAFVKPVFRWGLDTSFLRFYYDCHDEGERQTLASTIVIFLIVANGILLATLLVAGPFVNARLLGTLDYQFAYQLLIVNSFIGNFLFLPLNLLRIQERAALFASLSFIRSFGTVLARLVLVVAFGMGVLGLVLADTIVTAVLVVALAPSFRSMIRWRFSSHTLRALLRYGLPQVPHGLLSQTMAMSDRFFLGLYLPLKDVGVYLIGNSIAAVLKFFPVAFEAAWMPFAFDSMRRADAPRLFARLATYAFGILVVLTLAIAGLADHVVALMVPPDFYPAAIVIPLLAVGIAIQSLTWFLATSFNIAKRTHAYPLVTAVGAAGSIVGNVMLIPRFGILGAAMGTVAGQAAATATAVYFAQRAYRIPYELSRLARLTVVALAVYAMMMIVGGPPSWPTLAARVGLLALMPLGVLALRVFDRRELAEMKQVGTALADALRRSVRRDPGAAGPAGSN